MRTSRRGILISAVAVCAGAVVGAMAVLPFRGTARPPDGPNVLLIVVDALRPDHLGCYGYARPTSPNIDALAGTSTTYIRNKSQASMTVPALSSMFTSRLLVTHFIPEDAKTLPQVLRDAAYRTMAVQTNPWLDERRNFTRAFDDYNYLVPKGVKAALLDWNRKEQPPGANPFYVDAAGVTEAVGKALDSAGARPFFLYVHYMDVHGPYVPSEEFDVFSGSKRTFAEKVELSQRFVNAGLDGRKDDMLALADAAMALYDGQILQTDDSIGRVIAMLKERGIFDRTIVVLTSDHGEGFSEHGQVQHGGSLYETQLHTPLVIKMPGQAAAARVEALTRSIDITPTVLRACGVTDSRMRDMGFAGRALQDIRPGEEEFSQAALVMGDEKETKSYFSVEKEGFKLIVETVDRKGGRSSRQMLFNLWKDPGETTDLIATRPEKAAELAADLPPASKATFTAADLAKPVTDEQRERLRSIGYLN